jgi:hypothetical protein
MRKALVMGMLLLTGIAEAQSLTELRPLRRRLPVLNLKLLTKTITPGYTVAWAAQTTTCDVYPNKVVIKRELGFGNPGKITTVETKKVKVSGDTGSLIGLAHSNGTQQVPGPYIADLPGVNYHAYNLGTGKFLLESRAGSNPTESNQSPAARMLIRVMDELCPSLK